jgi:phosphatidylserine synthase
VRWSLIPPLVAVSWMTLKVGPAPTLAFILLMLSGFVYLAGYRRKFRR